MMFRIFFVLIFAVALTAGAWLFWYFWEANRFRQGVNRLLAQLDLKYTDFVKKRITLSILEDKDSREEFSRISLEAERILKPDVEALYARLNSAPLTSASLKYHSPYFAAIIALIESRGGKYKQEGEMFSKNELYQALKDAIDADLAKRELDYKVGNTL
ncbi:MAG: hypothetical protein R8P61_25675 [Bacteroidia bacterium]|nr:hypothetical protein [Bacteroidia bacterium]